MPPATTTAKTNNKPANLANAGAAPTPSVPAGAGNAVPTNEQVDINASNSRIAELQAALAEEQNKLSLARTDRLKNAHIDLGFPDTMSLIKGLRAVMAGGTIGANGNTGGTRTRATITDETKAQVKKLVGEKKTGEEIAAALGISVPSVQNIKKELKLTNIRKK